MNAKYNKLIAASHNGDVKLMQEIYISLLNDKMKLDKFFSMYLDKVGNKMDPENTDTNIWKLYREKSNEYSQLNYAIKSANYYLNKHTKNV
jgi:hypothetical protein